MQKELTIKFKARYFSSGAVTTTTKHIWFVFHGYGQLAALGFSQGAATASRWAADNRIRFDRLILWAGVFPADMDFNKLGNLLQHKEVLEVYGTHDPFLTEIRIKEMAQLNQKLGLNPTVISFDGKHELNAAVLKKLSDG
ncbi:MAG: hypothetical protein KF856_06595 [Cyclobacteriaceae bacterium]|nr:hypothetical protein [Cyclobacteriaceae bacterium]